MFTLLSDENNFKILFQKHKIKLIGVQHGGSYGEINNWNCELFEKEVSDIFYHWGLGENNIIQNKFQIKVKKSKKIKRFYLVGTPNFGLVDLHGTFFDEGEHKKVISRRGELIFNLSKKKKTRYIRHLKHILKKAMAVKLLV